MSPHEQHKRTTHLVRQSLLAHPISNSDRRSLSASAIKDRGHKPETFKHLPADVELKMWAKGIHK